MYCEVARELYAENDSRTLEEPMIELPKEYTDAEQWATLLLERIEELRSAYQDPDFRAYFNVTASSERAAVRRTSLDLSRALSKMRNTSRPSRGYRPQ